MTRLRASSLLLTALLAAAAIPMASADASAKSDCAGHGKRLSPEERAAHRSALREALFDSWSLSDDQRAALDSAHTAFRQEAKALHDRPFDSRDAKRDAWQTLREEHRQALDDILDDAQLAVIDQLRMPHHHREGAPQG